MRRYFVLLLALLVLCVSGLVYADVCLVDQRDRVELKQNVVYGDEKYAEGVTVNSRVQLKHQLFWETTHQLGQEKNWKRSTAFLQAACMSMECRKEVFLKCSMTLT